MDANKNESVSEWIYPFKGRHTSLSFDQNFLWRSNNVYIMDNHRAALWCWLQHIDEKSKYGLFHIDAHYDMAKMTPETLKSIPDLEGTSFEDYLNIPQPGADNEGIPVIRWDNYLTLFTKRYSSLIGDFFTATHKIGDPPPDDMNYEEIGINSLPDHFFDYLNDYGDAGWILNLDLDYFFTRISEEPRIFLNDSYVDKIFDSIKIALDSKKIAVLTICLSPECCGDWKKAEEICNKLCKHLGLYFVLPPG